MKIRLLFILLLFSNSAQSATKQLEFQTNGLVGLAHVFYGLTFADKHTVSAGVGYVPDLPDHDDMTLFSLKYRFTPNKRYYFEAMGDEIEWQPYSFSVTLLQGEDNDIYSKLPSHIPDNYYQPSARRIIFGMQTNFVIKDNIELYWDWSVLEVGLVNYVRNFEFYRDNYDFLGLEGIVSYGVGVRVKL